jgi:hypothetical protein
MEAITNCVTDLSRLLEPQRPEQFDLLNKLVYGKASEFHNSTSRITNFVILVYTDKIRCDL